MLHWPVLKKHFKNGVFVIFSAKLKIFSATSKQIDYYKSDIAMENVNSQMAIGIQFASRFTNYIRKNICQGVLVEPFYFSNHICKKVCKMFYKF